MTEPPSPSDARAERRQNPQSLRLRSLTPSYTVDGLEASLAFYVDGLGFTLDERWEDECDGPKTEPWGSRTLTVVDPDGFKLTFTPPQD